MIVTTLRGVGAFVAAYAVIVVFALLFQDLLFGGLSAEASPLHHLIIGGGMTAVGAFVGGLLMGRVASGGLLLCGLALSIWLIGESTYLNVSGITGNPLWFDVVSGATLAAGVLIGVQRARARQAT